MRCLCLFLGLFAMITVSSASTFQTAIMPQPATIESGAGQLGVDENFRVGYVRAPSHRLESAVARGLRRAEERTGLTFARTPTAAYTTASSPATATLLIECQAEGEAVPQLGEDESYELEVSGGQARLKAPTTRGAMHGLETLWQLLQSDSGRWFLPAAVVRDQPRFPWRGLMIDVARHWQPMAVLKRNLDGMALVKLNVLHLHLTEDQGFRIESKRYPKLHELGSDGHYFTQNEMRELIGYAAERGIRVVPEFDIPGHATSWVVAYPELASAPGPYILERKWGVFDPVLDPTNPKVYELLDGFLGEMAALFPDPYLHIGGDENNGLQWKANPAIQRFIQEHQLKDNAGLHAYFNGKITALLTKYGKRLVGWDEILHPDLPAGSVVHSWRGPDGVAAASARGFATILSHGYYIDLCQPTAFHYLNDPAPVGATLSAEQRKLVLGGEATMWAEWVTPETIDSRIWPRTAAIAERLWSPAEVRDVPEMYRRLSLVARRLEEAGLQHESYLPPALRRLAGDRATEVDLAALRWFVDLIEPVKEYARGRHQPDATQATPLTGLVDCARPDSARSREFIAAVDTWLREPRNREAGDRVARRLAQLQVDAKAMREALPRVARDLGAAVALLNDLSVAFDAGATAGAALREARVLDAATAAKLEADIAKASEPRAAVEVTLVPALQRLVAAASVAP